MILVNNTKERSDYIRTLVAVSNPIHLYNATKVIVDENNINYYINSKLFAKVSVKLLENRLNKWFDGRLKIAGLE